MTYLLDTSVIIDNVDNIKTLSRAGVAGVATAAAKILIPDIVLNECDHLKHAIGAAGFMARRFNANMQNAKVLEIKNYGEHSVCAMDLDGISIDIISKNEYKESFSNNYTSIVNDRRIIEIALWAAAMEHYQDLVLVSSDAALRVYAATRGLVAKALNATDINTSELLFIKTIEVDSVADLHLKSAGDFAILPHEKNIVFIQKNTDFKILANVINSRIEILDEERLRQSKLPPKNTEQLFFANLILHPLIDIVASSSPSGSGKTALSCAFAMKLIDSPNNTYERLVYVRNPIDSVDREAYIGFKKGDLEDKLEGYFTPLRDALQTFAGNELRRAKKDLSKASIDAKVDDYIRRYNIEFPYVGSLRGGNLSNAVIIIDEAQNFSLSAMQLILTRVSDTSKVVIIGDNNQIDSIYLSRQNNALSFILEQTQKNSAVNIAAVTLSRSVRGKVCSWASEIFEGQKYF
ncbi:MAG: PhoH family protein [Helicobacteraceae bacterium]